MNNRKFKTILIYCLIFLDHFKYGRIRLDMIGNGHVQFDTVMFGLIWFVSIRYCCGTGTGTVGYSMIRLITVGYSRYGLVRSSTVSRLSGTASTV